MTYAQEQAVERERAEKDERKLLREAAQLLVREPRLTEAEQVRLAEIGPQVARLDGLTTMRQIAKIMRSGLKVF